MEKTCATLREACYRYKKYDNYFLALHYVLQLKGSEGDTEYAILESRKMREEAVRLHVDRGVFLSYITEGKSYVFARNTEKAIEQYLKALEIEGTTFGDKLMVHGYLASSYYLKDKYKEALGELKAQRQLIDGVIKKKTVYAWSVQIYSVDHRVDVLQDLSGHGRRRSFVDTSQ